MEWNALSLQDALQCTGMITHVKKQIALLLRGELTANSLRSSGALLLRR